MLDDFLVGHISMVLCPLSNEIGAELTNVWSFHCLVILLPHLLTRIERILCCSIQSLCVTLSRELLKLVSNLVHELLSPLLLLLKVGELSLLI